MKFKYLKLFIILSIVLGAISKQATADSGTSCDTKWKLILKTDSLAVWLRCWTGDTATLSNSIAREFKQVSKHSLLAQRLPKKVGVLVDGGWTKSSGYWANDLKTPDGDRAILLSPEAVLEAIPTRKILAHELIHLVHDLARPHEESWVREGVALLSEYVITGFHNPALLEGFNEPETSLLATRDPKTPDYDGIASQLAQYGHVAQYFYYLYRLCGGNDVLNTIIDSKSELAGIDFIDRLLSEKKSDLKECSSFKKNFAAFETARFLNNSIQPQNLVYPYRRATTTRSDSRYSLPPYSASAYTLSTDAQSCHKGETVWEPRRCIRIRFE